MAATHRSDSKFSRTLRGVCVVLSSGFIAANGFALTSVKTTPLESLAVYPESQASATVISLNDIEISAEIPARLLSLPVEVGSVVDKGARLATLDCREFRARLQSALGRETQNGERIRLAEKRIQRARKLEQQQSLAEEILDERITDLAVLKADKAQIEGDLALARLNVSRCTVVAPFDSLITERVAGVGQYLRVGDTLMNILDVNSIEISAQVSVADLSALHNAETIQFRANGKRYAAILRAVVAAIETASRTQEVRLTFPAEAALIGSAGQIVWRSKTPHVPGHLVVNRDGELGVFVLADGVAKFVSTPAAQGGRMTPLDLPATTEIITEGHYNLRSGERLNVVPP
ncbi:MAG: efflux RND transporter periplasmic adaptor subunit [Pseudomonadota bacterium]